MLNTNLHSRNPPAAAERVAALINIPTLAKQSYRVLRNDLEMNCMFILGFLGGTVKITVCYGREQRGIE